MIYTALTRIKLVHQQAGISLLSFLHHWMKCMSTDTRLTLPRCTFKPLSLAYALKIALATLLVWPALSAVGIEQPVWAVVTIAAVSDPNLTAAKQLVINRVTNTLVGCVVAILTVVLFGSTLTAMIGALAVSVVLVTSIEHYPTNWRLAPITVAILMGGAVGGSQQVALHLAWLRASEIICGSLAALLMAWVFSRAMQHLGQMHHKSHPNASDE
jgi:uncharacterized membrane protein YccC